MSAAHPSDGRGGDPADASDFGGALPSGSVTFLTGETEQTIEVTVLGDTAVEPDESFTVTLADPTGADRSRSAYRRSSP